MKRCLLTLLIAPVLTCNALAAPSSCKPSVATKVPVITGKTYHKARKALLAAGWQPVQTVRWQELDERLFGQAKNFWQNGYVEVEDCAGSGMAPCSFLLKDVYGNRLQVVTEGEEAPKEKAFAVVKSYQFVCD